MEIHIRPATVDDMALVQSSWKRTWRTCPWAGVIRNDQFYDSVTAAIEGLIMRGAQVLVAHPADREGVILGWVCHETVKSGEAAIHYLYVKDPYLGTGINERLLEAVPGTKPGFFTFRYRQVADTCLPKGFRHAPEIARRK